MKPLAIVFAVLAFALAGCGSADYATAPPSNNGVWHITQPGPPRESNAERVGALLLMGAAAFGDGYTSRSRIVCTSIAGITTCE